MPKFKYNGIVADTFLNIYEKFTSFCQVLKELHTKENCFIFFCLTVYMVRWAQRSVQSFLQTDMRDV